MQRRRPWQLPLPSNSSLSGKMFLLSENFAKNIWPEIHNCGEFMGSIEILNSHISSVGSLQLSVEKLQLLPPSTFLTNDAAGSMSSSWTRRKLLPSQNMAVRIRQIQSTFNLTEMAEPSKRPLASRVCRRFVKGNRTEACEYILTWSTSSGAETRAASVRGWFTATPQDTLRLSQEQCTCN